MGVVARSTNARRALLAAVHHDESVAQSSAQLSEAGRIAVLEWIASGCYDQVIREMSVQDPELAD